MSFFEIEVKEGHVSTRNGYPNISKMLVGVSRWDPEKVRIETWSDANRFLRSFIFVIDREAFTKMCIAFLRRNDYVVHEPNGTQLFPISETMS